MQFAYLVLMACQLFSGCHLAQGTFSREYVSAINNGALAKVTLQVKDDEGHVVSNAAVRIGFVMLNKKSIQIEGETDTNGLFVAEAEAQWELGARISKEGYYDTVWGTLLAKGNESVSNGRWLPWSPTISVVLKSKRNPIRMIHSRNAVSIPHFDEKLGFDFAIGDWVAPHGKGVIADMVVSFVQDQEVSLPYRKLVADFPSPKNGAYYRKKDEFSVLTKRLIIVFTFFNECCFLFP
jgi:hypothetical protein